MKKYYIVRLMDAFAPVEYFGTWYSEALDQYFETEDEAFQAYLDFCQKFDVYQQDIVILPVYRKVP